MYMTFNLLTYSSQHNKVPCFPGVWDYGIKKEEGETEGQRLTYDGSFKKVPALAQAYATYTPF